VAPASYTEYEYELAMALASNPGLACFDDMNHFSAVVAQPVQSAWDNITLSGDVEERDDFDETTVRVDVFQVSLNTTRDQQVRGRPFKFNSAVRVVSKHLTGFMPAADLILVDAFPLTRDVVLNAVRLHLMRTEYAKEMNQFLWGPELVTIRDDAPQQ
jgi:hypothetical protein